MPRVTQRAVELLSLAVGLVAGYLYLEELGRIWLFWLLAAAVLVTLVAWHGRHRIRRILRRAARNLGV